MHRNSFIVALSVLLSSLVSGQTFSQSHQDFPVVGRRCPDFVLRGIQYYDKKNATLNDLKGTPFILDFFTTGCTACFRSLPKINQLRKDFAGKVDILMVGRADKYIRGTFEKFRKQYSLDLPVVYDTVLFRQFGIQTVPHIVWVDAKGIVRAISYASDLDHQTVESFLVGGDFKLGEKPNSLMQDSSIYFDYEKPLLISGNGGSDNDFLYRSILAKWDINKTRYPYVPEHLSFRLGNKLQVVGSSLSKLYILAYGDTVVFNRPLGKGEVGRHTSYGQWWPEPVLELSDTSMFQANYSTAENLYSYSLIVPRHLAGTQYLRETFQRELINCFGFQVRVEKRKMSCWKLIVSNDAKRKLLTKGDQPVLEYKKNTGLYFRNQPMSALIFALWASSSSGPPILDETGIKENIDIDINAITTDFYLLKNALRQEYGLDLVKGEKEMNVVVISKD